MKFSRHALRLWLVTGYGFLYLPIFCVMVYSFNDNRLVTVWSHFSTRWYHELWHNAALLHAAALSLRIAFFSALLAVVLGTATAVALVRYPRSPARTSLSLLVTAPLILPDVITGLSLLLLFIALETTIGWPAGRGVITILVAHATMALAYTTVIIRSRLEHLDKSLEEAALDLGARPLRVFFTITLPLVTPAMIAAGLLAFTLSLDDLVIASFVAGPGSTTLPMVVYSSVRMGVSPQINVLATLMITIVAIAVACAGALLNRETVPFRQPR